MESIFDKDQLTRRSRGLAFNDVLPIPLLCLLWSFSLFAATPVKVVHYNIKELTSKKIKSPGNQLNNVKTILQKIPFDILSIQELQYDLPGVPDRSLTTRGKNMEILLDFIGRKGMSTSFVPSNTGQRATKKSQK